MSLCAQGTNPSLRGPSELTHAKGASQRASSRHPVASALHALVGCQRDAQRRATWHQVEGCSWLAGDAGLEVVRQCGLGMRCVTHGGKCRVNSYPLTFARISRLRPYIRVGYVMVRHHLIHCFSLGICFLSST